MVQNESLRNKAFSISSSARFDDLAISIFRLQADNNPVYRQFIRGIGAYPEKISRPEEIPFLPIELFKTHKIITGSEAVQEVFTSSGTTGLQQSSHYVTDLGLYEESYRKGFQYFYGDIAQYTFLALLPSYLERKGSSLIYMAQDLIRKGAEGSGFYLHNRAELASRLKTIKDKSKVLLIGVTYALLDLADEYPMDLGNAIIMETGGMKGKRREMIREEVHRILCDAFNADAIHSEYGMTELLSQAYSKGNGIFHCPPWMKVMARDTDDPLSVIGAGRTGGLNVIDLANINSCSFIATQDLGKVHEDGSFEVLGRFDNSDIRGCNLMVL
jgi:phenylacetate-coenzyme A ligase PaaK-like adenylate-forming protein